MYLIYTAVTRIQIDMTTEKPALGIDFITELEKFRSDRISALKKTVYRTEYDELNDAIGGGFTPGLISLGAVSSLGKSTFALQIAHSIARCKKHVLYFSLEMIPNDIIAKALVREMHLEHSASSVTVSDLLSSSDPLRPDDGNYLDDTIDKLRDSSDYHLTIIEPKNDANKDEDTDERKDERTVHNILRTVDKYIGGWDEGDSGREPFVIIDYLQILSPAEGMERCTDKQIVDSNISVLKEYADDKQIPILLISSFNRDSYAKKASLQSFKDSGNIEYTSDVLMALQYEGAGSTDFNIEIAQQNSPRKVELIILKQRYGPAGQILSIPFYPEYNLFDFDRTYEEEENDPLLSTGRLPEARRHL